MSPVPQFDAAAVRDSELPGAGSTVEAAPIQDEFMTGAPGGGGPCKTHDGTEPLNEPCNTPLDLRR